MVPNYISISRRLPTTLGCLLTILGAACQDAPTATNNRPGTPLPHASMSSWLQLDSTSIAGELLLDTTFTLPATGTLSTLTPDGGSTISVPADTALLVELSGSIQSNTGRVVPLSEAIRHYGVWQWSTVPPAYCQIQDCTGAPADMRYPINFPIMVGIGIHDAVDDVYDIQELPASAIDAGQYRLRLAANDSSPYFLYLKAQAAGTSGPFFPCPIGGEGSSSGDWRSIGIPQFDPTGALTCVPLPADTTSTPNVPPTGNIRLRVWRALSDSVALPPPISPTQLAAFRADSNQAVVPDFSGLQSFPKNVVLIRFHDSAPATSRAALLDSIGGNPVGLLPVAGGYYYVSLDQSSNDGSTVFATVDRIRQNATVDYALPDWIVITSPSYRRPVDGTGFTTWQLSPLSADGDNWHLEAINAPMAWGCAIGDSTLKVAVVDRGFTRDPDLVHNTRPDSAWGTTLNAHGTAVASVLGAVGNNTSGITGTMWRAHLMPFDIAQAAPIPNHPGMETLNAVQAAILSGAQVINISLELRWATPPHTQNDSLFIRNFTKMYWQAVVNASRIARGTVEFKPPLFVISAGNISSTWNPTGEPFWAGYPLLRDSIPDNVIVVAGATRTNSLASFSNRDLMGQPSRIDVAAPAESIHMLNGVGQLFIASGNSFATPQVSGIAGLLLSFDPRIPTADLKGIIMRAAAESARRLQRTAGPYPIVDADLALREAAARTGAPVCGNRVWADNGQLLVERHPIGGSPFTESVGTFVSGTPSYALVYHDGRLIQNYLRRQLTGAWQEFAWTATGLWQPQPYTVWDPATHGGTFTSSLHFDHDYAHEFVASPSPVTTSTVRYDFMDNGTLIASSPILPNGTDSSSSACVQRDEGGNCVHSRYGRFESRVEVAMAPDASRAFYALMHLHISVSVGAGRSCGQNASWTCYDFEEVETLTQPTNIYEVNMASHQASLRWVVPAQVFSMGVAERNDEIVTTEGSWSKHRIVNAAYVNDLYDDWLPGEPTYSNAQCRIVFRDIGGSQPTGAELKAIDVGMANHCGENMYTPANGTISPRRVSGTSGTGQYR